MMTPASMELIMNDCMTDPTPTPETENKSRLAPGERAQLLALLEVVFHLRDQLRFQEPATIRGAVGEIEIEIKVEGH